MNATTNAATARAFAHDGIPAGARLMSVNGVHFGDPAEEYAVRPGVLFGRSLTIEGDFQPVKINGYDYVLVTVWAGAAMVTLTLNPEDLIVLTNPHQ